MGLHLQLQYVQFAQMRMLTIMMDREIAERLPIELGSRARVP